MKKEEEFFIVFNTKDFGVEILTEVDLVGIHKIITTKKEMLKVAVPLVATMPITEVVVELTLWLIAKIDLGKHYSDEFWSSLPLPLKKLFEEMKGGKAATEEESPAPSSIPDYVSCLLEPVDGFGLTIRTKNGLRRGGVEYIWQLAQFSPTDFKNLLKLHQFGKQSQSDLKKVLGEKLGSDFFGTLKHLNVFIHETLMSRCDKVPEIADCQEYQYCKNIFTDNFLAQKCRLMDYYAYQQYFPDENDFLPSMSIHRARGRFYETRSLLRERISEYLAKVIKESFRLDC